MLEAMVTLRCGAGVASGAVGCARFSSAGTSVASSAGRCTTLTCSARQNALEATSASCAANTTR